MTKLKILNYSTASYDEIENLRRSLPHLTITNIIDEKNQEGISVAEAHKGRCK